MFTYHCMGLSLKCPLKILRYCLGKYCETRVPKNEIKTGGCKDLYLDLKQEVYI